MFDRSMISTKEDVEEVGAGLTLADIGRALMVWVSMQDSEPTVAHAATLFNTSPDIIREAVTEDHWSFLEPDNEIDPTKQRIAVDGD